MSVSCPRILPAGFIEPCIPTAARVPPSGPGWLHEIKHDGYRLIGRRERRRVRLFSRRGMIGLTPFPRSVKPWRVSERDLDRDGGVRARMVRVGPGGARSTVKPAERLEQRKEK